MIVNMDAAKGIQGLIKGGYHFNSFTSAPDLAAALGISQREALTLCQNLASSGFGRYVVGRKGWPTRIEWNRGHPNADAVEAATSWLGTAKEDVPAEAIREGGAGLSQRLTITEAKERLAVTFGVSPANIEITIRA
jgi:hypothetical protein